MDHTASKVFLSALPPDTISHPLFTFIDMWRPATIEPCIVSNRVPVLVPNFPATPEKLRFEGRKLALDFLGRTLLAAAFDALRKQWIVAGEMRALPDGIRPLEIQNATDMRLPQTLVVPAAMEHRLPRSMHTDIFLDPTPLRVLGSPTKEEMLQDPSVFIAPWVKTEQGNYARSEEYRSCKRQVVFWSYGRAIPLKFFVRIYEKRATDPEQRTFEVFLWHRIPVPRAFEMMFFVLHD